VLLGYAGSGYKGMQINATGKTIEGDLFTAFIKAGAISKANADDPKKSSLVRCARTDKGVHAAGNVISLKLIVEDPDIIKKINENLPEQIRVWGFERTNGSFSCYQTCDSRWYEYLIPTYSFLPPHPQSYMGKKLVESAETEGVIESYNARQEDVAMFWEEAEKKFVEPILAKLTPELRSQVLEVLHASEEPSKDEKKTPSTEPPATKSGEGQESTTGAVNTSEAEDLTKTPKAESNGAKPTAAETAIETAPSVTGPTALDAVIKEIKAAYIVAKKAYRISSTRRAAVQEALSTYLGTQNFHNYTILKTFKDPSAKRVIRSFNVGTEPIIINDTEWLSLKVHGQSFMMHQIRKMVAMAALVVRCGTPMERIKESYGPSNISIPKAPGLGLLLERPVFETYNKRAAEEFQREQIDFGKYEKEIEEFKQREIYERIFREEEKDHQYAS
jgi:tRNA pseudouridine38-40 synthase